MNPPTVFDQDAIITAADAHWEQSKKRTLENHVPGFTFTPEGSEAPVWVKYDLDGEKMRCEANTQSYVQEELLKNDDLRKIFRIPEVYDWFEASIDGCGFGFIIMEYMPGVGIDQVLLDLEFTKRPHTDADGSSPEEFIPTESEENKTKAGLFRDRIADFICFLLKLSPAPETPPGAEGGGRMINKVFGRWDIDTATAPADFETLKELEDYINHYIESTSSCNTPERVDLIPEGLKMCWCDLHYSNFIMEDPADPSNPMTVIDFEFTSWAPYSFLIWALREKSYADDKDKRLMDRVMSKAGLKLNPDNMHALDVFEARHRNRHGIPSKADSSTN